MRGARAPNRAHIEELSNEDTLSPSSPYSSDSFSPGAHGVPLRTVQQVLRHSKVGLTADLYGHLALDVTRQALQVMDALD